MIEELIVFLMIFETNDNVANLNPIDLAISMRRCEYDSNLCFLNISTMSRN